MQHTIDSSVIKMNITSSIFSPLFLFIASLIIVLSIGNASATTVRPLNLNQMHQQAELIFHGRCIKNWSERDSQLNQIVTMTTFEVIDNIKGNAKSLHTIKQIGGSLPGNLTYKVQGVPTFKVGEEYIIFLLQKSKLGFSSPVALSQGKFNILKGAIGKEASNGRAFTDMLQHVPDKKLTNKAIQMKYSSPPVQNGTKASKMEIKEFKDMLRTLGKTNGATWQGK